MMTPTEPSLWSFISGASWLVKGVLLILLAASVASWTLIIQRMMLFKQSKIAVKTFEQRFWSGIDLGELFKQLNHQPLSGLAALFYSGFQEFTRLYQKPTISAEAIMEGTHRAIRVAYSQEMERLERHLPFLATVGSTSPYVGLFGTVWGIMTTFRSLVGSTQQTTIAMVAPGISEALIATAFGLFAAIPAVVAYNRFNNHLASISHSYEVFQEELLTILHRKAHSRLEAEV